MINSSLSCSFLSLKVLSFLHPSLSSERRFQKLPSSDGFCFSPGVFSRRHLFFFLRDTHNARVLIARGGKSSLSVGVWGICGVMKVDSFSFLAATCFMSWKFKKSEHKHISDKDLEMKQHLSRSLTHFENVLHFHFHGIERMFSRCKDFQKVFAVACDVLWVNTWKMRRYNALLGHTKGNLFSNLKRPQPNLVNFQFSINL